MPHGLDPTHTMATPHERLAESLSLLKSLQDQGLTAIQANQLTRTHRERLLNAGFLREVMKGWYIPGRPDEPPGETTAWYASFWAFVADYLEVRFHAEWVLSPEQSLSVHIGDWTVPKQLLVRSPRAGNKPNQLLFGTSLFDIRLNLPAASNIEIKSGLRLFKLPAALVSCAPGWFTDHPLEMRAALAMVPDASDVLSRLLAGNHSMVAGRLAGAFRNIGRNRIADQILQTMRAGSYTVNEANPFADQPAIIFGARETSPYVNRMRMMWAKMRTPILQVLPAPPGLPQDREAYLKRVDDIYVTDAYHSLSIEGYQVSADLIERVRSGNWNPENNAGDRENRDALAARGYWQAFQSVKTSMESILAGANPGETADADYSRWYSELFGPSVGAGILRPADLAGFRNGPVYIRRSMHVPANAEAVRELMPAFFELLRNEAEPAVRVVLGHFIFVYIHPYVDGNGRMGRFLMNLMLAAGGYPWAVIPVERRGEYMAALESASVDQDIEPFARLIATLLGTA